MFLRVKRVKGNPYFYLVESKRIQGKSAPVQRVKEYLGNQQQALRKLSDGDYPDKEQLISRVRAEAAGSVRKRGRPKRSALEPTRNPAEGQLGNDEY